MTHENMYNDLRATLSDVLTRLKVSTVGADGHGNRYMDWDENSHCPNHILAAWPRYHIEEGGWDEPDLILTPEFCSDVAGGLDHLLVTTSPTARELFIYLDACRPPGVPKLALEVGDAFQPDSDLDGDLCIHRRSLRLLIKFDSGDEYEQDVAVLIRCLLSVQGPPLLKVHVYHEVSKAERECLLPVPM